MLRIASLVCGCIAVVFLALAVYHYATHGDPAGETLAVDERDRAVGILVCEEQVPVRFRIKNTSSQAVQVLGLAPG